MYLEFVAYKHSGYALHIPNSCAAKFLVMTALCFMHILLAQSIFLAQSILLAQSIFLALSILLAQSILHLFYTMTAVAASCVILLASSICT